MDQKYKDEFMYRQRNGHSNNLRSQWDNWEGWNANAFMDTGRNFNEWGQSNRCGIRKQHSQELQNLGSSASISKQHSMENHNRLLHL